MDKSLTIADVINNDHIHINELYQNYVISKGNIDDQQRWSNQLQEELIRHITNEELILYPSFEKYLHKQGHQITDQDRHDHRHIKKLLFILSTTAITDPQYDLTFHQLIKTFNQHIKREQDIHLPILENQLTCDLNILLAQQFQQTKNSHHIKVYPSSSINAPL